MDAPGTVLARRRSFHRRKRPQPIAPAEGRSDDAGVTTQISDSASAAHRRGLGYSIDVHADGNERADDRITVVQPNGAVLRPGPDDMARFAVTGRSEISAESTDAAKATRVFSSA